MDSFPHLERIESEKPGIFRDTGLLHFGANGIPALKKTPGFIARYRLNKNAGQLISAHIRSWPPSERLAVFAKYAVALAISPSVGLRFNTER